jgi:hypothetical protein
MALPATYEILRDGRPVSTNLYRSSDEILEFIGRTQPTGVYDVYKKLPPDPNGVWHSAYIAEVTKHENGKVTHRPLRSPSRNE